MNLDQDLAVKIRAGEIGVLPTDTIYGLVGSALNSEVVERIYLVRERKPDKPFIILISDQKDLEDFGIRLNDEDLNLLNKFWPGPVSIILPCADDQFEYLYRGTKTLAFRLPENDELRRFLAVSGPLVAPSANPEGQIPAKNISEAREYFGDKVDFYFDAGELVAEPSALIKIENGQVEVLRSNSKIKELV